MSTRKSKLTSQRWDEEYKAGAHWEKEHSSQMQYFVTYLKPGAAVLDAGCGSGRDSLFLARQGYTVIGIDISEEAIKKAKARATEEGLAIRFDVGILEKLPYTDQEFDAIYSGYTLQHTDLEKTCKELARVLKKDGLAYIVMFEKTAYEKPGPYDTNIEHDFILNTFSQFFTVTKEQTDEYNEEDQHGRHMHRRLVLVLSKHL